MFGLFWQQRGCPVLCGLGRCQPFDGAGRVQAGRGICHSCTAVFCITAFAAEQQGRHVLYSTGKLCCVALLIAPSQQHATRVQRRALAPRMHRSRSMQCCVHTVSAALPRWCVPVVCMRRVGGHAWWLSAAALSSAGGVGIVLTELPLLRRGCCTSLCQQQQCPVPACVQRCLHALGLLAAFEAGFQTCIAVPAAMHL